MEIFSRKLQDIKKNKPICVKRISGVSLSKLLRAWRPCTIRTFSTGIWRVPIYFWTRMEPPNLAIWMSPRWPSAAFCTLKPVRLTMLVLKFGVINPMTWRAIFGHLAASCMNQSRLGHPSELMTWQAFIGRYFGASTRVSLSTFQVNLARSARLLFKCRRRFDPVVIKFLKCRPLSEWVNSSSWTTFMIM